MRGVLSAMVPCVPESPGKRSGRSVAPGGAPSGRNTRRWVPPFFSLACFGRLPS